MYNYFTLDMANKKYIANFSCAGTNIKFYFWWESLPETLYMMQTYVSIIFNDLLAMLQRIGMNLSSLYHNEIVLHSLLLDLVLYIKIIKYMIVQSGLHNFHHNRLVKTQSICQHNKIMRGPPIIELYCSKMNTVYYNTVFHFISCHNISFEIIILLFTVSWLIIPSLK